ncbi:MAG TPA: winged helix-turn-helix domain-containing protein [Thermoguttaceae bacterium]|nr:winged helix-turn-helix domain-containing protein [Thermoguttaceae bacterium]
MATAAPNTFVEEIGETAGLIWHTLDQSGPMSLAKLVKKLGKARDLIMQALGWLAREGKIEIREENRSRVIAIR